MKNSIVIIGLVLILVACGEKITPFESNEWKNASACENVSAEDAEKLSLEAAESTTLEDVELLAEGYKADAESNRNSGLIPLARKYEAMASCVVWMFNNK